MAIRSTIARAGTVTKRVLIGAGTGLKADYK